MGQDIAEFQEFDETRQTKWELLKEPAHKGIHDLVRDLNHLYQSYRHFMRRIRKQTVSSGLTAFSPREVHAFLYEKVPKAGADTGCCRKFCQYRAGILYQGFRW